MAYKIGSATFLTMMGNIPAVNAEVEVITKPGEDGFIRRELGLRSPPFEVETTGTYLTELQARNDFEQFGNNITAGLLILEKDTVNYSTQPAVTYGVYVLNVVQAELSKKACIAGTVNTWLLRCVWTLILA